MTAAMTKSDGWFWPFPNQFLMALTIPVGFSKMYAYVIGSNIIHRTASINFRTYLSWTADSIVLLALQLKIMSSVAVNTKKYSNHRWTWPNYITIMKGYYYRFMFTQISYCYTIISLVTLSRTSFHSKYSCVKLQLWYILFPDLLNSIKLVPNSKSI